MTPQGEPGGWQDAPSGPAALRRAIPRNRRTVEVFSSGAWDKCEVQVVGETLAVAEGAAAQTLRGCPSPPRTTTRPVPLRKVTERLVLRPADARRGRPAVATDNDDLASAIAAGSEREPIVQSSVDTLVFVSMKKGVLSMALMLWR
jgi:hypothetical protein